MIYVSILRLRWMKTYWEHISRSDDQSAFRNWLKLHFDSLDKVATKAQIGFGATRHRRMSNHPKFFNGLPSHEPVNQNLINHKIFSSPNVMLSQFYFVKQLEATTLKSMCFGVSTHTVHISRSRWTNIIIWSRWNPTRTFSRWRWWCLMMMICLFLLFRYQLNYSHIRKNPRQSSSKINYFLVLMSPSWERTIYDKRQSFGTHFERDVGWEIYSFIFRFL